MVLSHLIWLLAASPLAAATRLAPSLHADNHARHYAQARHYATLRGGGYGGDDESGGKLSKDEVMAKLNGVPTFVIVDEESRLLNLQGEDGEDKVVFFIEAGDAEETLAVTCAGNPELKLRLAAIPLGTAFTACETSPDQYKLQGCRTAMELGGDEAAKKLRAQGVDPGSWVLPVFCSDDFQTPTVMPLFFSTETLERAWVQSGRKEGEAMFLLKSIWDLRSMVLNMMNADGMPWSKFQFCSDQSAYKLAEALQAAARQAE